MRGVVVWCVALVATQLVLQAQASSTNKLLDLIAKKRYDEFVEELSVDGVDANQPDSKGRLPLLEAVRTRDVKYVDALIQFGALANSRDPASKLSPVQLAVQNGLVEITKLLLAYGADLSPSDKLNAKARDGASGELKAVIAKWDEAGAQGFEDAPGTWTKSTTDAGNHYWYNEKTKESRWNVPPSCAWQKVEVQGHPHKYTNYVTGQTVHRLPNALAWRHINQQGQDLWFNWRLNTSQHARPDELPDDVYKQLVAQKNVRWYNPKTQEFSWEDPKYLTAWRELQSEDGKPYYFNVVTGDTVWEAPVELAWRKVPSEEHPGREYWHNPLTGESTWEEPGIHGWEKHDSDIL